MKLNLYFNILELLKVNNLSIAELERKTNLGNGTIRRWNDSMPSIDKVIKVADFLNITVDNLINIRVSERALDVTRKMEQLTEFELDAVNNMIDFFIRNKIGQ